MAFITYPLNNIDYTAEDAELFHCTRSSGIWAENSFSISVTGANNNVTIGAGLAWINNEEFSGKVAALKSAETLDLGIANNTYPRIDVIAIQFNANNNATRLVIKKGTAATNPVRPAIVRTGAVYELYLASVYRPAGATAITAANITDLRMDATVCGLMADSVTKVDMEAIRAQLMGLVDELEDAIKNIEVGQIIPIEKGGTGATTLTQARQNINFIGANPIANREDDTTANWVALGTGVAYVNKTGLITDQPTQYGWIENYIYGASVYQVWRTHSYLAGTWVRTGTSSGWYSTSWIRQLDEKNGIQMKKLWQNASPTSVFVSQTLDDELVDVPSNYSYILIDYEGVNTGAYTESILIKVGKSRYLTWVRYPETSGQYMVHCSRRVTVNTDSIELSQGSTHAYNSTSIGHGDDICVPVNIYGIKGVQ